MMLFCNQGDTDMKYTLITLAAAVFMFSGCASTGGGSGITQKTGLTSGCVRTSSGKDVVLTGENISLQKNDRGCFGGDSPFCDIRMYQIMAESFRHGNGGASGPLKAWGPSSHTGNLKGVIDSLDYIKSTGANAVWLTPIFKTLTVEGQDWTYDKLDGTGYYTSDYFSIDPKFGTKEELAELVKQAHARGMYVFLDGVFGHAKINVATKSPKGNELKLTVRCVDSYGKIDKIPLKETRCFETADSMKFLKEVASYWIREVKIDGWRLDQAYQVTNEFWKELSDEVIKTSKSVTYKMNGKNVHPLGYMVGEIWSEQPKTIERTVFKNNALASAFNFPLRIELVKVLATRENISDSSACSQPATELQNSYRKMQGYTDGSMPNMFLSNHDVLRFGDLLQRAGYEEDGVHGKSYFDAHRAALSFLAAYSGPITVYYGDETGDETLNFVMQPDDCGKLDRCDDHVARTDGHVDRLTKDEEKLKNDVAAMMRLRDQHKALSHGVRTHLYSDHGLFIDLKSYGSDRVIYALNAGTSERKVTLEDSVWSRLDAGACTVSSLNGSAVSGNDLILPGLSGSFYEVKCR